MESSNPLIDISFYPHDISACCCIVTVRRLEGERNYIELEA